MTEAEAKTRWCPFAASRVIRSMGEEALHDQQAAYLSDGVLQPTCLGSLCMVWTWDSDFNKLIDRWPRKDSDELKSMADGHCGLAR